MKEETPDQLSILLTASFKAVTPHIIYNYENDQSAQHLNCVSIRGKDFVLSSSIVSAKGAIDLIERGAFVDAET